MAEFIAFTVLCLVGVILGGLIMRVSKLLDQSWQGVVEIVGRMTLAGAVIMWGSIVACMLCVWIFIELTEWIKTLIN